MTLSGRTLVHNSLLNVVGQVVPLLVGVATVPFIVRSLGAERFGLLSIAWVVLSYAAVFDLGLGRASTKFVAEALARAEREKVGSVVAAAVVSQAILGTAGGLGLALLAPLIVGAWLKVPATLVGEATEAFRLLGLAVPLVMVSGSLSGALQGAQRFDLVNAVQVPATVSVYLTALLAVLLGFGLPGIVTSIFFIRVAAFIALLALCVRHMGHLRSFSASIVWSLFSFGGWVTVSNMLIPITVYSDRLLIAALKGAADAGHYVASYDLVNRILVLPSALAGPFFPALGTAFALGEARLTETLLKRFWRYVLATTVPAAFACSLFAPEILTVAFGAHYARDGGLLRLLAGAVILNALAYVPFTAVQAIGRPDIIAKYHLAELPVYIAVVILLLKSFGSTGAAAAWCLRMIWTAGVFSYVCMKPVGASVWTLFDRGSWTAIGFAALLVTGGPLFDGVGPLPKLLLFGTGGALYFRAALGTRHWDKLIRALRGEADA